MSRTDELEWEAPALMVVAWPDDGPFDELFVEGSV